MPATNGQIALFGSNEQPVLVLRLMGSLSVELRGQSIDVSGKLGALLILLAVSAKAHASREWLASMLWADKDDQRALHNLRQLIARIRKLNLGSSLVISETDLILDPVRVECDIWLLEKAAEPATNFAMHPLLHGQIGSFCSGFSSADDVLDDLIRTKRGHYDGMAIDVLLHAGGRYLLQNQPIHTLELARKAVNLDYFREDAHRLAMRALADLDRRSEAIRHYDSLCEFLADEIDSEPDELTQSLAASLKLESNVGGGSIPAATISKANKTAFKSLAMTAIQHEGPALLVLAAERAIASGFEGHELDKALMESGVSDNPILLRRCREVILHLPTLEQAIELGINLLDRFASWEVHGGLHPTPHIDEGPILSHPAVRTARQICKIVGIGQLGLSLEARERLGSSYAFAIEDISLSLTGGSQLWRRAFVVEPLRQNVAPIPLTVGDLREAIAVIPFVTLATEAAYQNLGDLIAEELIAMLSRRREIRVISRLSTNAFKGNSTHWADMQRFLGANFGVTGTCTIFDEKLRILVEFVDFSKNEILWAESLRCSIHDALASDGVVDEFASRIVATMLRKSVELVRRKPLPEIESSTLLLGAITLMHHLTPERFDLSRTILEVLGERYPQHAVPQAWMGMHDLLKVSQGWSLNVAADMQRARDTVSRALDLDPENALALSVGAHIATQFDRDFDAGAHNLHLALQLDPNNGLGWLFCSARHAFLGEGEAATYAAMMASHLSPLDPRRWLYDSLAATAALGASDFEKAITLAKRSLQGNAMHTSTYRALAIAQQLAGHKDDAQSTAAQLFRLQPDFSVASYRRTHPTTITRIGPLWADALRAAGLPE